MTRAEAKAVTAELRRMADRFDAEASKRMDASTWEDDDPDYTGLFAAAKKLRYRARRIERSTQP